MKSREPLICDLIVIGGGAAGFFGAIQAAEMKPGMTVMILEKSTKVLSKVKVSGGGRCNVTHHCYDPIKLAHHYPRGEKKLKNMFKHFQSKDMVDWLLSKGVKLKTEADGRMFPVTDNSQTIIDCFIQQAISLKVKIEMNVAVHSVYQRGNHFEILCQDNQSVFAKKVLIATGGSPNRQAYQWIEQLGHTIHLPIPSLFTFNDSVKDFSDLMGVAVPDAEVRIAGTKFFQQGPVLITHWGLSGPAVIKLSAWAAEHLHRINYQFTVLINWIGIIKEDDLRTKLQQQKVKHGRQKIISNPLFALPQRLWERLCVLALIEPEKIWAEISQKSLNKLVENLIRCSFLIKGKTTFKEEFVTCGGVELNEVNLETMESKKTKGVFFAGEVLHVDGETGGFNFQAAWTTAFLAARAIV